MKARKSGAPPPNPRKTKPPPFKKADRVRCAGCVYAYTWQEERVSVSYCYRCRRTFCDRCRLSRHHYCSTLTEVKEESKQEEARE